jgi:hypothetical protein
MFTWLLDLVRIGDQDRVALIPAPLALHGATLLISFDQLQQSFQPRCIAAVNLDPKIAKFRGIHHDNNKDNSQVITAYLKNTLPVIASCGLAATSYS